MAVISCQYKLLPNLAQIPSYKLLWDFLYRTFKIEGVVPNIPLNYQVSSRPQAQGTMLHENTCFGSLRAAIWRAVRPVRVEKEVKPRTVYFTPSPRRPPK